ncbi:MAG: hypothetical protein FVQ80_13740 [Planctomycetes bacterium]|nr:hypothetical protein [Planctomycetota bacterium]
MSDSPGIIPTFGIKPGTVLGGYQVKKVLGRGYECEAYEGIEISTRVRRALKFYRMRGIEDWERVRHTAWFYQQLAPTGVVALYHHLGSGFLPKTGEPVAMLVVELIKGVILEKYVRRIKGRRLQREQQYLRLIASIAENVSRIHKIGFAAGDIENLENTILTPTGRLVFIDIEPGQMGEPNRDYQNDIEELLSLFDSMFSVRDQREVYVQAKKIVENVLDRPIRRDSMKRVAIKLKNLLEAQ